MISVLIADDHPVVRDGIKGILSSDPRFRVVGEAEDGRDALRQAGSLRPDVILMDLRMPVLDGISATREILLVNRDAKILILTTYDTDRDVQRALSAGAIGYLLKDCGRAELASAVEYAALGRPVLPSPVLKRILDHSLGLPESPDVLTKRELEVLQVIARGNTNHQAARILLISDTTVKTHLSRAYAKLGVTDRASAVNALHNLGLL